MAERRIVIFGEAVLREVSEAVDEVNQQVKDLVSDLEDTLKKAKGLGLSAVQIGVLKRVFILDLSVVDLTETLRVFINPEIIESEGEAEMEEGCLSFPGIFQRLSRPGRIKVKALDENGEKFVLEAEGIIARAIQHENDHLDAVLFIDHFSALSRALVDRKLKRLSKSSV